MSDQRSAAYQRVVCPECEGDGYTESWNDDQTDVVITLCTRCALIGDPNFDPPGGFDA